MKIWLKYLVGTVVGVLLFFIFPGSWGSSDSWLSVIFEYLVRALRYSLFPFIGFSMLVAIYDLKKELRFARVMGRIIIWGLASTLVLIFLGSLVLTFFPPQRIPVLSRLEPAPAIPSFLEILNLAFPKNVLSILGNNSDLLLPVFVFGLLIGLVIQADKRETFLPIINLSDSFSRIFYQLNYIIVEITSLLSPILVTYFLLQVFNVSELRLYLQSAIFITAIVLFAVFGVFPLLFYILSQKKNPYKIIFSNLGASIIALFTGDVFAAQGTLILQSRENLGVSRKIGALSYPYLALFSRGGTALVSLIGFYVVLRSYSSLDVTLEQFIWALGASTLVSFLLPTVPGSAAYISIVVLCQWYGKGLEVAYLNLLPMMLWFSGLSAFADVTISGLITAYVGQKEGVLRQIELKKFI